MKFIALACFSWLVLLTSQAAGQPAKNEFSIVVDGVKCTVSAYKPKAPIVFEPLVDKDFRPKFRLIVAIMLPNSDISSYMSDEEISEFFEPKLSVDRVSNFRAAMKAAFNPTLPSVTNPWKEVKYSISQAFEVESEKGKFLVYQLAPQGGKDISGELTSSIKNVAGKWSIGAENCEAIESFRLSILKLVPAEFAKINQASSIEILPFEDLLK